MEDIEGFEDRDVSLSANLQKIIEDLSSHLKTDFGNRTNDYGTLLYLRN
jgi:hypothetical protein